MGFPQSLLWAAPQHCRCAAGMVLGVAATRTGKIKDVVLGFIRPIDVERLKSTLLNEKPSKFAPLYNSVGSLNPS